MEIYNYNLLRLLKFISTFYFFKFIIAGVLRLGPAAGDKEPGKTELTLLDSKKAAEACLDEDFQI